MSETIRRAFLQKGTVYLYESYTGDRWWDCAQYQAGVFKRVATMRLKGKFDFPDDMKLVVHSLEYDTFAKHYGELWAARNLIINRPVPTERRKRNAVR